MLEFKGVHEYAEYLVALLLAHNFFNETIPNIPDLPNEAHVNFSHNEVKVTLRSPTRTNGIRKGCVGSVVG